MIRYEELTDRPDVSAATETLEGIGRGIDAVRNLASPLRPLSAEASLEDAKHRIADIAGILTNVVCDEASDDQKTDVVER